MEVVREILLLLIKRKRAAERGVRTAAHRDLPYHYGKRDEAATICEIARTTYHASRGRSPQVETERKRVIAITDQREEFVTFADGYVHLWPQGSPNGAWTAWHLRVLADELDRRNRAWDLRLQKHLGDQLDS